MPVGLNNHVTHMSQHSGSTVDVFGKDSTGAVSYQFNLQGFRGNNFDTTPDHAFFGCSLVFGIGVESNQVFASQFVKSYNFGLAGFYNNADIYQTIMTFAQSSVFDPGVKLCVVWADRHDDPAKQYFDKLTGIPALHFFCGTCPQEKNAYPAVAQIDSDVSNTHPGPKTHALYKKVICQLFNQ